MKILIIYSKKGNEISDLEDALRNVPDCETVRLYLDRCVMTVKDGVKRLYYDGEPVDVSDTDVLFTPKMLNRGIQYEIIRYFESLGIYTCPSSGNNTSYVNKFQMRNSLRKAGIPTPCTVVVAKDSMLPDNGVFKDILKDCLKTEFPYLVKPNDILTNDGIRIAHEINELTDILSKWTHQQALIQEYINPGVFEDERHIVIGDEVVSSMTRTSTSSNVCPHPSDIKYKRTVCDGKTRELCVKAARAMDTDYASVSIKRDGKGNPYVLGVNCRPSIKIIQVSGLNHFYGLLEYFKSKTKKDV